MKERKKGGNDTRRKGNEVKADTFQLGQNCKRSRAQFNIVAEIAFLSKEVRRGFMGMYGFMVKRGGFEATQP